MHSTCMISASGRTEQSRAKKRKPNKYSNMLAHLVRQKSWISMNHCYPPGFSIKANGDVYCCFRRKSSWWNWPAPLTPFRNSSCGICLWDAFTWSTGISEENRMDINGGKFSLNEKNRRIIFFLKNEALIYKMWKLQIDWVIWKFIHKNVHFLPSPTFSLSCSLLNVKSGNFLCSFPRRDD